MRVGPPGAVAVIPDIPPGLNAGPVRAKVSTEVESGPHRSRGINRRILQAAARLKVRRVDLGSHRKRANRDSARADEFRESHDPLSSSASCIIENLHATGHFDCMKKT